MGAVSYLNTRPLVYGFEQGLLKDEVELIFDYPARVAAMLMEGKIDVGLIPVAVLPHLKTHYLISDYCIGASKPVGSVCLFSDVPITAIKEILVDYQSRTSAALLKVLLKEYWNIAPVLTDTSNGYQQNIKGTTAGLIIGDRALVHRSHSPYIYDLAEAWQQHTGLPFVFAAWIANKKLPDSFTQSFNKATGLGLQHIPKIVDALSFKDYDMRHYYQENIDYTLDEKKLAAVQLFLKKIRGLSV